MTPQDAAAEIGMLNRTGPGEGGEAVIHYGDADYQVLKHGSYVLCAVTGARIALEDLKYWSVDAQEAYADSKSAMTRWKELNPKTPA